MMGFEPMTPCLQGRCSPSWATPPYCGFGFLLFSESKRKDLRPTSLLCVSTELSSRTVARKVLSPLQSLTSVFGMGTGGPSAFVALTILALLFLHPSLNIEQHLFRFDLRQSFVFLDYAIPISPYCTFSIERRWSSRTFRYGYLVTT